MFIQNAKPAEITDQSFKHRNAGYARFLSIVLLWVSSLHLLKRVVHQASPSLAIRAARGAVSSGCRCPGHTSKLEQEHNLHASSEVGLIAGQGRQSVTSGLAICPDR